MIQKPLIIIHGWHDDASSFQTIAHILAKSLQLNPTLINLANYVSMDDQVTFFDLAAAMQRAWQKENLPVQAGAADVIVHSTGGLVIREWLTRFWTPATAPIKHLLMLAPANFGSHLASKGLAFYSRVLVGFNSNKMFNVGEQLLKGLELASPYNWQLAIKDRFTADSFYQPGRILCTVLIGNTGLSGISSAANIDGSDGVVPIACANLNCSLLEINFNNNPLHPTYSVRDSNSRIAFGVMAGENHRTIMAKEDGFANPNTRDLIIKALTIEDENYAAWCDELDTVTQQAQPANDNSYYHAFQNTVVSVFDQFTQHIQDYIVEFYGEGTQESSLAELFHNEAIASAHNYSDDNSYRTLYMDCNNLFQGFNKATGTVRLSITASPQIGQHKNIVGYQTFTDAEIGSLAIDQNNIQQFFTANRTLLMPIILRREQLDNVFNFFKSN